MKKITVILADDHTIVREGLRRLLETAADIEIVAEATNGYQALQQATKLRPDLVLLDIAMPQLNGLDAARRISKKVPTAKVLILSAYNERQEVHAAIEAGAAGFVTKQTAATELLKAIRETSAGKGYFSAEISNLLPDQTAKVSCNRGGNSKAEKALTSRETEVLQLIAGGNSNKEMAATLFISIKTIEKHRQTLMKKTRVHEAASLTRYAISNGFVPCERPRLFSAPAWVRSSE